MTDPELDISKTTIKKEMTELKQLGDKIVALTDGQFKTIPLDEKLFDAMTLARKITKHGGLKRQLQYIGKLMRHIDPEPIRSALEAIESGHKENTQLFHQKEQWRDELLNGGADKLTEFISLYPDTELQPLRQAIRNHKNAKNEAKKVQTARIVYKLVSEQIT